MKETQEQQLARAELKSVLELLQQTCDKHKAAFVGFIFSAEPVFILRFGNVKQTGNDFFDLLRRLESTVTTSIKAGNVVNDPLGQKEN